MGINYPRRQGYRFQDRDSNCGPFAVYNAMIWVGKKPDIYRLEGRMQCGEVYGTSNEGICRGLKYGNIFFSQKKRPKLKDIKVAIDKGMAVIYCYRYNKGMGHFVFIDGYVGDKFRVVNDVISGVSKNIRRLRRKSYYAEKRRGDSRYPHAWFIRRKKRGNK